MRVSCLDAVEEKTGSGFNLKLPHLMVTNDFKAISRHNDLVSLLASIALRLQVARSGVRVSDAAQTLLSFCDAHF